MNKYAVGLDIGGTDLKLGIVSLKGKIVHHLERPTGSGRQAILKNIRGAIQDLVKQAGCGWNEIFGIGAGTPGLADAKGKIVTGAANIKGWNGTGLGAFLARTFKTEVSVDNDVTALAMGESLFGSGKGMKNFISLAFGTGLGGGIITNGQLYRGKWGYAGEIGHMIVNCEKDAPLCTCGNRGCLETYASRVGIERLVRKHLKDFPKTKLTASASAKDVYDSAEFEGDKLGLFIVGEIGYRLGIALATLVNIFDPEAFVMGGGIAKSWKILNESFLPSYEERVLAFYRTRKVKFLRPELGKQGGIVGTASLILRGHV